MKKHFIGILCAMSLCTLIGCTETSPTVTGGGNTTPILTTTAGVQTPTSQSISGIGDVKFGDDAAKLKKKSSLIMDYPDYAYEYKGVGFSSSSSDVVDFVEVTGTLDELNEFKYIVNGKEFNGVNELINEFGDGEDICEFYKIDANYILYAKMYKDNNDDTWGKVYIRDVECIGPKRIQYLVGNRGCDWSDEVATLFVNEVKVFVDKEGEQIVLFNVWDKTTLEAYTDKDNIYDIVFNEDGSIEKIEKCEHLHIYG